MTTHLRERPASKSGPRAVFDRGVVLATVEVAVPPERVFRALTTNEVERWWGSADTYRMTDWTANLRVGGGWSVVVRGVDGSMNPTTGRFLEIDPPRRVMHTRKHEWEHPTLGGQETMVTYTLEPIPTGTRVIVRHEGFVGKRAAANEYVEGWERVLGWLEAYMRSEGSSVR